MPFDTISDSAAAVEKLNLLALVLLIVAAGLILSIVHFLSAATSLKVANWTTLAFHWMDRNLVIIFLLVASVLGTGYAFLDPPGSVPDEISHAGKVARISTGDWVGTDNSGPFPPVNDWYGSQTTLLGQAHKFSAVGLRTLAARQLECSRKSTTNSDAAAGAGPLQYIAPSTMFIITCAQGGSFGLFLYGSRLLNLAIYLALVAIGIRYAGFGRWSLFSVALLPMSLYLASSISYDAPMLAGTFCLLGLVSGVYSSRITCRKAIIPIIFVSLFLAFQKPQAGWVFVLPIIAVARCREQHYSWLKWSLLTGIVPLSLHLMWVVARVSTAGVRPDVAAVNGMESLLHEPGRFVDVFISTYTSSVGVFVAKGLMGILGWLDVYLSPLGYKACLVALLLASVIGGRGERLGWIARSLVTGAALGAFILSNVSFYTSWTEPGSGVIQGLQGRYFLTMAAVIAMASPFSVRSWWRTVAAVGCVALLIIASLSAYEALLLRYF